MFFASVYKNNVFLLFFHAHLVSSLILNCESASRGIQQEGHSRGLFRAAWIFAENRLQLFYVYIAQWGRDRGRGRLVSYG